MSRHRTTAVALLVLLAAWAFTTTASAGVPRLIFPILGATSYTNDFGAPRPSGGHQGNDIMAAKRTPVVAVESGRAVKYTRSSNAGCMLYLYGKSGTTYMYIHLNNDRTLRNDNRGGCRNRVAYAPRLERRQWVKAGQLIGYVGDSGDANGIASHLHFEVHPNGGRAVSPYRHLRAAYKHLYPRPAADAFETLSLRVYGKVVGTGSRRRPAADPHPGRTAPPPGERLGHAARSSDSRCRFRPDARAAPRSGTGNVRDCRARQLSPWRPRRGLGERLPREAGRGPGGARARTTSAGSSFGCRSRALSHRAPYEASVPRALGLADSPIARTTAIRLAPAATTSCTFVSSMPPIANQGTLAWAAAWRTYSSPVGGRPSFVGVANTGPMLT